MDKKDKLSMEVPAVVVVVVAVDGGCLVGMSIGSVAVGLGGSDHKSDGRASMV